MPIELIQSNFYPRPPRGGRHRIRQDAETVRVISIHVLREEDDPTLCPVVSGDIHFYPRPPRGGRLLYLMYSRIATEHFYPRPPRGGRQDARREVPDLIPFLSTSSARRTTRNRMADCGITQISIHVLREEDDNPGAGASVARRYFYPRPPRGGRPAEFVYEIK